MEYKDIIFEVTDGVAVVTLNRPSSFNSINDNMLRELTNAFDVVQTSDEIRVLFIKASGKAFCSGGDVKEMLAKKAEPVHDWIADTTEFNTMAEKLMGLDKVVICAVQGIAAGAGCNIAIAADFTYASEDATFIEVFTNIGLIPDAGGCYSLPRIVGRKKAAELMITHKNINAAEAKELGMITDVFPLEQLNAEAEKMARKLAQGPTLAYAGIKRILRNCYNSDVHSILAMEAEYQAKLSVSDDFTEGLAAFKEKRKAEFKGK